MLDLEQSFHRIFLGAVELMIFFVYREFESAQEHYATLSANPLDGREKDVMGGVVVRVRLD